MVNRQPAADAKALSSTSDQKERKLRKEKSGGYYYHEWNWHPIKEYSFRIRLDCRFDHSIYNKPIPPPVMLTIGKILQRIDDAEFYVTDIRKYNLFLGVTVTGSDTLFVVERWNEPAFR